MQHVNRKPPTAATEDPLGFVDPLAALLAGGTDDPLGTASGGNNGGGAGGSCGGGGSTTTGRHGHTGVAPLGDGSTHAAQGSAAYAMPTDPAAAAAAETAAAAAAAAAAGPLISAAFVVGAYLTPVGADDVLTLGKDCHSPTAATATRLTLPRSASAGALADARGSGWDDVADPDPAFEVMAILGDGEEVHASQRRLSELWRLRDALRHECLGSVLPPVPPAQGYLPISSVEVDEAAMATRMRRQLRVQLWEAHCFLAAVAAQPKLAGALATRAFFADREPLPKGAETHSFGGSAPHIVAVTAATSVATATVAAEAVPIAIAMPSAAGVASLPPLSAAEAALADATRGLALGLTRPAAATSAIPTVAGVSDWSFGEMVESLTLSATKQLAEFVSDGATGGMRDGSAGSGGSSRLSSPAAQTRSLAAADYSPSSHSPSTRRAAASQPATDAAVGGFSDAVPAKPALSSTTGSGHSSAALDLPTEQLTHDLLRLGADLSSVNAGGGWRDVKPDSDDASAARLRSYFCSIESAATTLREACLGAEACTAALGSHWRALRRATAVLAEVAEGDHDEALCLLLHVGPAASQMEKQSSQSDFVLPHCAFATTQAPSGGGGGGGGGGGSDCVGGGAAPLVPSALKLLRNYRAAAATAAAASDPAAVCVVADFSQCIADASGYNSHISAYETAVVPPAAVMMTAAEQCQAAVHEQPLSALTSELRFLVQLCAEVSLASVARERTRTTALETRALVDAAQARESAMQVRAGPQTNSPGL